MEDIIKQIIQFRNERDWKQFHNAKDLATAIGIETSELQELFLWKNPDEVQKLIVEKKESIGEEMADILIFSFLLCHDLDLNIEKIIKNKIDKNNKKYPVHKAKGKHTKYNQL